MSSLCCLCNNDKISSVAGLSFTYAVARTFSNLDEKVTLYTEIQFEMNDPIDFDVFVIYDVTRFDRLLYQFVNPFYVLLIRDDVVIMLVKTPFVAHNKWKAIIDWRVESEYKLWAIRMLYLSNISIPNCFGKV